MAISAALRVPGMAALAERALARGPAGPEGDRRQARVACVVYAEGADGGRAAVRVEGEDAYGFTAVALVGLAARFRDGRVDATGARAPAEVVEPLAFLEAFNHLALYNCRHTLTLLSGEPWNVRCPPFDSYVDPLVRYVRDVQARKKQARDEEAQDPLDIA